MDLRQSFSALKHRNFQLFAIGQFTSLIGTWMQSVGQSWLVYRLTGSAAYLGAIAFCQQIPILLFAFGAGGLVDRTNRHRMVIMTQTAALIQAAILAYLTYAGRITIPYLFVLAGFMGIINAFDMPARQAFLIQMVSKEDLMNAIAINSSLFNAARIVGPALAGIVVARWGEALTFLLNAISYLAVLISLLLMVIPPGAAINKGKSIRKDLAEGLRYVRGTKPVRGLLLLIGGLGFGGFPFVVLLPIFADRIFHRGASGLGLLMTATGIGALAGALYLASRKDMRGIGKLITVAAVGFSVSLMLFSAGVYFWASFLFLVGVGAFMMSATASVNTAIQSMIPDAMRGRIMSLYTTMFIGTAPLGSLVAGELAHYIGPRITVFAMAFICLGFALWFYRTLPSVRAEARRLLFPETPE